MAPTHNIYSHFILKLGTLTNRLRKHWPATQPEGPPPRTPAGCIPAPPAAPKLPTCPESKPPAAPPTALQGEGGSAREGEGLSAGMGGGRTGTVISAKPRGELNTNKNS